MSELKLGALWLTVPDLKFKTAPSGDTVDFEELIHEFTDCFMFILYNMHYDDWYPELAEVEWEAVHTNYSEMRDLCWVVFQYLNSTKFRRWRTYAGMTYEHAVMKFNAMTGDKYPCGRRTKVKRSPVLVDFDSPDADEDLRPKRFQRTYDGEDDDVPQGPSTYHNPLKRDVTSAEANVPYQPDFDSVPIEYDDEGWAEAEAGQMSHGYYEGEYYKKLGSLNNSPAYVNFLKRRAEPILNRVKKAKVNRHKLPVWVTNPAIQPTIPMAFKKARSLFYIDLTDDDRDWGHPSRYSPVEIWEDEIIREVDGDDHFDVYMGDGSDDCCLIEDIGDLNSLGMDIEPENPVEEATQVDPSLSSVSASTIASAQRRQQEEDDEDLGLVHHWLQTNPEWQAQVMNEQLQTGEIQVPTFDDMMGTPESYLTGSDPLGGSDFDL